MKAMLRALGQLIAQVVAFLVFFMILGTVAGAAKRSISAGTEFHWVAGVVVGSIWLVGVFTLCFVVWYAMRPSAPKLFRKYVLVCKKTTGDAGLAERFPAATFSALMCVAILTAVVALSGLSEVLALQGFLAFTVESSHEIPTAELLFRLYMWHTIDMIPLLDIWRTYDIRPPLRPENFGAQSTVLAFRTAIVGFAITVTAQLVKFYRQIPSHNADA
jgi:hypothetical protein